MDSTLDKLVSNVSQNTDINQQTSCNSFKKHSKNINELFLKLNNYLQKLKGKNTGYIKLIIVCFCGG